MADATPASKAPADGAPQNAQDLTVFVQSLLEQMVSVTRFGYAECVCGESDARVFPGGAQHDGAGA